MKIAQESLHKIASWIANGGKRPFNKEITLFYLDELDRRIKRALKENK